MQIRAKATRLIPSGRSALLALVSSVLLALAFPDFEIAPLPWIALAPLFFAIFLERASFAKSFVTGWIFGTIFFFLTAWWLTFAPVTYAGFPFLVAYALLFCVTLVAGIFVAAAAGCLSLTLRRFGNAGIFAAPVFWIAFEFLRYWLTGNNWNTIGYSQAFGPFVRTASIGGVHLTGFLVVLVNAGFVFIIKKQTAETGIALKNRRSFAAAAAVAVPVIALGLISGNFFFDKPDPRSVLPTSGSEAIVVAVQPNVPMSGLNSLRWNSLRTRQASLAAHEVSKLRKNPELAAKPVVVILPESPMNYQYELNPEFRNFINGFAVSNRVSVLFNSAEPDRSRESGYFNSAVMIGPDGRKIAQYDKIHLLPFGEFVPLPEFAQSLIPPMVGRFTAGGEYDQLPVGSVKAGVMICFESHFPSLSREYVLNGSDVLIEMTNDGYLGPTPVLRQHLASAAFRAAETNRPVVRATNVGVTAFVNRNGIAVDEAGVYEEGVRVWGVDKSDGGLTLYVRFGDWFAWLCVLMSIGLMGTLFIGKNRSARAADR